MNKKLKLLIMFTMSVMITSNFNLNTFAKENIDTKVSEVTEIPESFMTEENNKLSFTILSEPTEDKNGTVEVRCIDRTIKSIEVPETVKHNNKLYDVISLGGGAFNSCFSLETISLPDSIIVIDDFALGWCTNLKSIKLPKNLTYVGFLSFFQCNLDSIEFPDKLEYIYASAFETAFSAHDEPVSITLPSSVKMVGQWAFANYDNLEEVIILSEDISIAPDAFINVDWIGTTDDSKLDKMIFYVVNQNVKDNLIKSGFKEENIRIIKE